MVTRSGRFIVPVTTAVTQAIKKWQGEEGGENEGRERGRSHNTKSSFKVGARLYFGSCTELVPLVLLLFGLSVTLCSLQSFWSQGGHSLNFYASGKSFLYESRIAARPEKCLSRECPPSQESGCRDQGDRWVHGRGSVAPPSC